MPQEPGVYLFLDKKSKVLYVGKAKNLKKRVASYFVNTTNLGEKTKSLLLKIARVKTIKVNSEIESFLLEANLVKKYRPKYNTRLTDGKAYPLIRITVKDRYPKILIARRADDRKSRYFGPFPSSKDVRIVLKTIRRIFPFQTTINHPKRPCLYYHLGLCPCPPAFDSEILRREYQKDIKRIIEFLQSKKNQVIKELKIQRDQKIKSQQYEKAAAIQKKIDSILYITSPFYQPFAYEINPNLLVDIRQQELEQLKNALASESVPVQKLWKVECYDISNLSGTHAVGSLVVFINGGSEKSLYRRFKIKFTKGPDDTTMIKEVLQRRLKHSEWELPDLIIVDGGKGQVSAILKVLTEQKIVIPVIGLAKREENIITSEFKMIKLPKDSRALQLIQRIRDEAHRFALSYHRKLRAKLTFG